MSLDFTINRAAAGPDGPFVGAILGLSPVDSDGVRMSLLDFQRNYTGSGALAADGKIIATLTGNELRYGRLRLLSFYGSELLPARVEYRMEYWNGTNWTKNTADSCSTLVAANVARPAGLGAPALTYSNGAGFITFPLANVGNYDIAFNLNATGNDSSCNAAHPAGTTAGNMPWLQFGWCAGGNKDPNARIRLGSPKAPYIDLRERY